ncbi:unnamed protein product [marine sediment metagenome]|uniref:Uncharacterized protein n=1 Tax=marine sediment metagenome TaxID=412755 RepID=X0YGB2_9ZZZZ
MDANGKMEHVSGILEQAAAALRQSDELLMREWCHDYPNLRGLILGATVGDVKWPAGSLTLRRDGYEILLQATCPEYGLQVTLRDIELSSLLERLEGHLDCGTTPWGPTYKERQKEKSRLRKGGGGS